MNIFIYGSKDTIICTATTIKPFESTCMDQEMVIVSEVRAHRETQVPNDII